MTEDQSRISASVVADVVREQAAMSPEPSAEALKVLAVAVAAAMVAAVKVINAET